MALLMQWQPFETLQSEMSRFHDEMDRLFDRWGMDFEDRPALAVSYPALNIWEDHAFVYAEAELPGMKLEDLEIYVTGTAQLTLKGTRAAPVIEKAVWHRQERGFGMFTRVITLPADVDAAKVEARLEQGVLTIKMAKSEAAKPKRIPVKAE